ncbi:FolC bifunctional protein [Ascobolus immersus RN42]|uniref:tetrahydrofolate synthase n=1 Tax=Ascobolus immersus RN42 TaxID=1160509 RepID=A0A3N4ICY1_ASCIM|nr:FolC bifunctional protein [Ascobolus immersus RN42]
MNAQAIPEMIEWVRRIGYVPSDFNKLNIIHISGTKGKGSTSALVTSILKQYPQAVGKVGLYTSPHLRSVRERIRIDGRPISETLFAKYFFEVWDRLEASAEKEGHDPKVKPVYFRYLTLMAFHVYLSEGVDAVVLEVGVGGEYDSTNVIEKPVVTAVTALGVDHTAVLGNTLEEIAWHKAGIFKEGAVALSVPQLKEALEVLKKRAEEKGLQLQVVEKNPEVTLEDLGLKAEYQLENASLAVQVAGSYLSKRTGKEFSTKPLPEEFKKGLREVTWPGRCEVRKKGNVTYFIDGAHTHESLKVAGEWFLSASKGGKKRALLFNQQTRTASPLLKTLVDALDGAKGFEKAVFSTNTTYADSTTKPDLTSIGTNKEAVDKLEVQNELAASWSELGGQGAEVVASIEEGVEKFEAEGEEVECLVTGSLHLVGGLLEVLEGDAEVR